MHFRQALTYAFHELLVHRNEYKLRTAAIGMHQEMFVGYVVV
jgi:hypothetical protein